MTSTLERLNHIYGINGRKVETPTPVQIQRYIGEQNFLSQLSQQTGILDLEFLQAIFFSQSGKFIPDKFQRFIISFKKMIEKYGKEICDCLDQKCIKPNGEIQEARLRRNRKK